MAKWIGVDLDGTLAHYDRWRGNEHIGEPIPAMVARVKAWLAASREVRIFTARVARDVGKPFQDIRVTVPIQAWCRLHLGQKLEITCVKDFDLEELWDDRAVGVVKNSGQELEEVAVRRELVATAGELKQLERDHVELRQLAGDLVKGFRAGFGVAEELAALQTHLHRPPSRPFFYGCCETCKHPEKLMVGTNTCARCQELVELRATATALVRAFEESDPGTHFEDFYALEMGSPAALRTLIELRDLLAKAKP